LIRLETYLCPQNYQIMQEKTFMRNSVKSSNAVLNYKALSVLLTKITGKICKHEFDRPVISCGAHGTGVEFSLTGNMWKVGGEKYLVGTVNKYFTGKVRCTASKRAISCVSTTGGDLWPKPSPIADQWTRTVNQMSCYKPTNVGLNTAVHQTFRHFSVSAMHPSQAATVQIDSRGASDPTPQGIQGDDCVNFRLWMESCQRYGLPGCDEQANHIVSGRKTLSEVFREQEQVIIDIARNYSQIKKKRKVDSEKEISHQGVQGDCGYCAPFDSSDSCIQGVQGLNILDSLVNVPSPQGIQGDECVQFKLWLENCHRFGLTGECEEQLYSIKKGRKTLAQIFEEQDILIRKIVQEYKSNRSKNESS
ncbi:uncharacterized protein LOC134258790, partial [Saccostrea cucullata]|uniref:uncharacterized protein LOC134258790 n=1 Tax=Saccostrea cuccullata TaxID=36930 RepID=UPI002ECFC7AD